MTKGHWRTKGYSEFEQPAKSDDIYLELSLKKLRPWVVALVECPTKTWH